MWSIGAHKELSFSEIPKQIVKSIFFRYKPKSGLSRTDILALPLHKTSVSETTQSAGTILSSTDLEKMFRREGDCALRGIVLPGCTPDLQSGPIAVEMKEDVLLLAVVFRLPIENCQLRDFPAARLGCCGRLL